MLKFKGMNAKARVFALAVLCSGGLGIGHFAAIRVVQAQTCGGGGCTPQCQGLDGDPFGAESSHSCVGQESSCSCTNGSTPNAGYGNARLSVESSGSRVTHFTKLSSV